VGQGEDGAELIDLRQRRPATVVTTEAAPRPGDHTGFAALVAAHDDSLRALAYHLLGSTQAMDDVMQEVYVKAYRGLSAFRGEAALGTWLHRIAYTTCIDHLRRSNDADPLPAETIERVAAPDTPQEDLALREQLRAALAGLPPEQRVAVLLVLREGYSYTDAAQIMDVPRGTVASRVAAGRTTLMEAFAPEDHGGDRR
jgi:RNA polymerase sigma-70 factor (ECF subfamily)